MDDGTGDAAKLVVGLSGGATALGWLIRLFRRRLSRDGVEIAKDRAEIDLLTELKQQAKDNLDRAERAEKERNEALVKVGELSGKNEVLQARYTATIEALVHARAEVTKLREVLHARRSGDKIC